MGENESRRQASIEDPEEFARQALHIAFDLAGSATGREMLERLEDDARLRLRREIDPPIEVPGPL